MSKTRVPTPSRPLRLRPLAACLASALLAPALLGAAPAATPRGALVVQNCDDGGPGSLRDTVASALDGDVVDLSGLACGEIVLGSGAIVIGPAVASLSIEGPGADTLAISGNDADRVFEHQGNGTFSVSGLTLGHGVAVGDGGCVLANGNLALSAVTVSACRAGNNTLANVSGGGIAVRGDATLVDARFDDNRADGSERVRGGAIAVAGTLVAGGSTFTNNHADSHDAGNAFANIAEGGAIHALAGLELTDSTVAGNGAYSASAEAYGGGIASGSHPDDAIASLEVLRSEISGNVVDSDCGVCAPQGGGIAAVGNARLRETRVLDNTVGSAGLYGGAGGMRNFDATSVEVLGSTIDGNHADSAGGGMIGPTQGTLTIDTSAITGNFAGDQAGLGEGGGGVLCFGCNVVLTSSTVSGNVAEADGGGINIRYGEYAPARSEVINSTISGSSADEGAGFMLDGGNAGFSNSTIAFNLGDTRGAGISASEYSYQIELQSTIVANNLAGGAANNVWAFPDTVSGANNLVPNAPGLPAAMPGDTLVDDPLLQPLADNGGPTQTHALGEGSPALEAGNNAIGLVFDQRGEGHAREYGDAADIGAFEQQPAGVDDRIFADGFEQP
jgi:hypothetical protein